MLIFRAVEDGLSSGQGRDKVRTLSARSEVLEMLMDIDSFYILSVAECPDEDGDGNEHRK